MIKYLLPSLLLKHQIATTIAFDILNYDSSQCAKTGFVNAARI
jgi:hypothetical protein